MCLAQQSGKGEQIVRSVRARHYCNIPHPGTQAATPVGVHGASESPESFAAFGVFYAFTDFWKAIQNAPTANTAIDKNMAPPDSERIRKNVTMPKAVSIQGVF